MHMHSVGVAIHEGCLRRKMLKEVTVIAKA